MLLLLSLFFCHFLADYTWLSEPRMLAAKRYGKPLKPIIDHGLTHAILMFFAMLLCRVEPGLAALLLYAQWISHTAIDVVKGRLNARHETIQNPADTRHWVVFGLDQYAHTVVILLMWYATLPQ